MLFWRKPKKKSYNPDKQKPVLMCSICTGERVAGFRDLRTGKFEEVTVIRTDEELMDFMNLYDIDTMTKEY